MRYIKNIGLDAFTLKIIAIVAMVIDHIGFIFLPEVIVLRVIGRLTFPIMGFFMVEGFRHTKNVRAYAGRLLLYGCITIIPYYFAFGWYFNVMFSLLCALIVLIITDKEASAVKRFVTVLAVSIATALFDWGMGGIWFIYILSRTKNRLAGLCCAICALIGCETAKTYIMYMILQYPFDISHMTFQLGIFMSVPLLMLYNGKRGIASKSLFYWFYPAHLAVMVIVKLLLR